MEIQEGYDTLRDKWRRKILKSYYAVVATLFVAEILVYFFMRMPEVGMVKGGFSYWRTYILKPTGVNLAATLLTTAVVNSPLRDRLKNFAVVLCLIVYCFVVATIHGFFLMTLTTFVLPVAVSVMFDDLWLTRLVAVLSALGMSLSTFTAQKYDATWTLGQRWGYSGVTSLIFIWIFYMVCSVLIRFGQEKKEIMQYNAMLNEKMRRALKIDSMTGLYNHTEFYNRLESYHREYKKEKTRLTVAVLDVDFFKRVNDRYGHECGDAVLIGIADVLKDYCCRTTGHAFRYGGEEFALVFRHKSEAEVRELMEKVREAVNALRFEKLPGTVIGISCGIYEYAGGSDDAQEIFSRADQALYQAKTTGRNRCVCYSEL